MSEQVYVQDNLSITTDCAACIQADSKCIDCQEEFDTKQSVLAHQIVDEGNEIYPRQWLRSNDEISGHDWIGSVVRVNGSERREFVEPVVWMEDRTFDPELELASNERFCTGCFTACIASNKCPNCEAVMA